MEGDRSGSIAPQERDIVRSFFHLDDRKVLSLLTPRSDILAFDLSKPMDSNLTSLLAAGHERFPIIDRDIDNPIGVLSAKKLLKIKISGALDNAAIKSAAVPPVFIPESWSGSQLLAFFVTLVNI